MFYTERIYVFFITLFSKKMEIILSASKPHWQSRLSKPILKILSIYRKNILGKMLFQAMYFKYVFRLLDALESQKFSSKLNMIVKVSNCSQVFYEKAALINFIGKHLCRSLCLNELSRLKDKKGSCTDVFLWVLPNIQNTFFCKNTSDDCFC